MGRSKLTLELDGSTFLERAIRASIGASDIDRRIVVVRPEDAALAHSLAERLVPAGDAHRAPAVEVLLNPDAARGQSASVRLAAERLAADPACAAVIYSVVDQPFLDVRVYNALVDAWKARRGEILVSAYGGQRGNPVLFARRFFDELSQLTGDVGGREVIRRHPEAVAEVPMPDPAAGRDIDTWEDYVAAGGGL